MGKYKLWLHHQEIGRRLRDQINTLEQERARVQKMTPDQTAPLPELDNPIIIALRSYTDAGNQLSNIDVIKAAMPKLDGDPDQSQPAPRTATATPSAVASSAPVASAADSAVVANLLARADSIPSDPLEQMRQMTGTRDRAQSGQPGASANGASAQGAPDSVQGWWQNRQRENE
jgi:hypothetical protein